MKFDGWAKRSTTEYTQISWTEKEWKKKLHRLKTRPIFTKASQTEWREPFDFPAGISGFSGLL